VSSSAPAAAPGAGASEGNRNGKKKTTIQVGIPKVPAFSNDLLRHAFAASGSDATEGGDPGIMTSIEREHLLEEQVSSMNPDALSRSQQELLAGNEEAFDRDAINYAFDTVTDNAEYFNSATGVLDVIANAGDFSADPTFALGGATRGILKGKASASKGRSGLMRSRSGSFLGASSENPLGDVKGGGAKKSAAAGGKKISFADRTGGPSRAVSMPKFRPSSAAKTPVPFK